MFRYKSLFLCCVLFIPALLFAQDKSRGYWIEHYLSVSYPLKAVRVNSSFGRRRDPFTGESSTHSGLDLQAYFEEVYAMFDGVVERIGSDERSGRYIILRHGSYTVSYCHLSKVTVAVGTELIAGDIVGISGNSGRSSGPHLHITCRHNGELVDPYTLLVYIRVIRSEAIAALGVSMSKSLDADCDSFFSRHAASAMEQQQRYGIPASVTLAQMAHESDWGRSSLARKGNNYFGIKCSKQWLADGKPYSLHDDDKPGEKFCNYATVDESVKHHSKLLMGERYKRCRRYAATDYHNWLVGLKSCGYATDKNYVALCEKLIKRYKLYLYDAMAL